VPIPIKSSRTCSLRVPSSQLWGGPPKGPVVWFKYGKKWSSHNLKVCRKREDGLIRVWPTGRADKGSSSMGPSIKVSSRNWYSSAAKESGLFRETKELWLSQLAQLAECVLASEWFPRIQAQKDRSDGIVLITDRGEEDLPWVCIAIGNVVVVVRLRHLHTSGKDQSVNFKFEWDDGTTAVWDSWDCLGRARVVSNADVLQTCLLNNLEQTRLLPDSQTLECRRHVSGGKWLWTTSKGKYYQRLCWCILKGRVLMVSGFYSIVRL
jgi:hypothetical protein